MESFQDVVPQGEQATSRLLTAAASYRDSKPASNQQSSAQVSQALPPEELERTSDLETRTFEIPSRSLEFREEATTNQLVVSVIDDSTDELVRQIPSEVALKIAKSLQGLLVDVTV